MKIYHATYGKGGRIENEDTLLVNPKYGIFVVADGASCTENSRRASIQVCQIMELVAQTIHDKSITSREKIEELFKLALYEADKIIHPSETTLSALLFWGNYITVIHIGDSCIYKFTPQKRGERIVIRHDIEGRIESQLLQQMISPTLACHRLRNSNEDLFSLVYHLLGNESQHAKKHGIPQEKIFHTGPNKFHHIYTFRRQPGSIYVLTTDGVHDSFFHEYTIGCEIAKINKYVFFALHHGLDPAAQLVNGAHQIQQKFDDASVIVIDDRRNNYSDQYQGIFRSWEHSNTNKNSFFVQPFTEFYHQCSVYMKQFLTTLFHEFAILNLKRQIPIDIREEWLRGKILKFLSTKCPQIVSRFLSHDIRGILPTAISTIPPIDTIHFQQRVHSTHEDMVTLGARFFLEIIQDTQQSSVPELTAGGFLSIIYNAKTPIAQKSMKMKLTMGEEELLAYLVIIEEMISSMIFSKYHDYEQEFLQAQRAVS